MMSTEHPITPPPELVEQWIETTRSHDCVGAYDPEYEQCIATQAARWGANQELEACCEYLGRCAAWEPEDVKEFCDLRRPKPPSLKQQALEALQRAEEGWRPIPDDCDTIRRALEALPDE